MIKYSTHILCVCFHYKLLIIIKKVNQQKYEDYIAVKFQLVRSCYIIHPRSIYIKNITSCVSNLSL